MQHLAHVEQAAIERQKLLEKERKEEQLLREAQDHLADLEYAEKYLGYRPRRKNDVTGAKKHGKAKGKGSKVKK